MPRTVSFLNVKTQLMLAALWLALPAPAGARVGVGDTPEIEFTAMDGRRVDRKLLEGKVVIVDFWATWCGPCVVGMPHMLELHKEYGSKGLQILGVSLDRTREALETFVKDRGIPWPQYYDGEAEQEQLARKWGINGIPAVFILSPKGKVLWQGHPGAMDTPLRKALREHLKIGPELAEIIKQSGLVLEEAAKALEAGEYQAMLASLKKFDAQALEDKKLLEKASAVADKVMAISDEDAVKKIRAMIEKDNTLLAAFRAFLQGVHEARMVKVGDKPEIEFTALDGRKVDAKYLEGKIVIVDFWATWCGPCIVALPHMKGLHEKHASKGVEILGISLDRDKSALETFVAAQGLKWVQHFDEGGQMATLWGVQGIPSAFILSPEGKVLWRGHPGEMDEQLEKAMKEHPPKKHLSRMPADTAGRAEGSR